ncbi:hypothetical protein BASA81_006650 [Batrachochytrium salamandrivorans]|nr:hypothetical protein BASA81_006650 [Batrachochytrium salamandrivorans]
MTDSEDWVFGAFLNISGSVCINLGTNLMKLGILRFQKRRRRVALQDALLPTDRDLARQSDPGVVVLNCCNGVWTWIPLHHCYCSCRSDLVSKTWFFGLWCFILGNVLNFLSFGYAAQSLLASLGSVQFVTNVLFARVVLKETITRRTVMGTLVLIGGMCLVVAFSCHGNPAVQYSLSKLISLFYDDAYLIYLACLGVMLLVSLIILHRAKRDERQLEGTNKLEALAYAAVSAIVGAHAVTFFKILSELMGIAANVTPDDHVTKSAIAHSPFTYIILLAAIFTSAFWMQRLNEALRLYNVLLIIPLFQVMWVSLSVIGGGIFFHEFGATCFKGETAFMFILGLLVIFFGVFLLSAQSGGGGNQHEQEGEDEENVLTPLTTSTSNSMNEPIPENLTEPLYTYNFGVNTVPVFGVVEQRERQFRRSSGLSLNSSAGPTPFPTPIAAQTHELLTI